MKTIGSACAISVLATGIFAASVLAQGAPQNLVGANTSGLIDQAQTGQLESLLGREVRTRAESDAGRIIDLLTDREGKLQAAVVEMGGFLGIGTRKIAVDWRAFNFDTREQQSFVILELNREQLRLAPEYTAREPVVVRTVN
jgi:PRC-barrel domain